MNTMTNTPAFAAKLLNKSGSFWKQLQQVFSKPGNDPPNTYQELQEIEQQAFRQLGMQLNERLLRDIGLGK